MSNMSLENARDPEQLRRMEILKESGLCYFCMQGSEENKTIPKKIYETKYWYITKNDFPQPGSVHHYLIISKRHVLRETELYKKEWAEFQETLIWIEKYMKSPGFSKFSRNGDMAYTDATIDHLHIQIIAGVKKNDNTEKIKITLAHKKTSVN